MGKPQSNRTKHGLTFKENAVIDHYFSHNFEKVAALRAGGYSDSTARHGGHRFFLRPRIAAEIERRSKELMDKAQIDRETVMDGLLRIAQAPQRLAKFKKVNDSGQLMWDFTGATEDELALIQDLGGEIVMQGRGPFKREVLKFKISSGDAKAAWDSLGRAIGMFTDKLEVTGEMSLVERLQAGRKRAGKG